MPDELRQDLFSGVSSDTLDTPLRPAGKKPGKVNYTKQTMRAVDSQVVTGFTSILEVCGKGISVDICIKTDLTPVGYEWFVSDLWLAMPGRAYANGS